MANTGYSQEWSRSSGSVGTTTVRLYYATSYNASTNQSTVTVTPQLKNSTNAGSSSFFDGTGTGNGGVWGNGSKLYALATSFGGTSELRGGGVGSFESMSPSSGSISTFVVSHNSSGDASFTLGLYGTAHFAYQSQNNGPIGSTAGNSITIHENAPYAITYNANGGTGAPASQGVYANVSYTISSGVPTRTGCAFLGWSTSSTASAPTYVGGDTVTPNGNLTLYAVWSYTVTCEDRIGNSSGTLLGSATTVKNRGASVSGADWGSDATYNQYYTGYYYTGCTTATVSDVTTVYRYFAVDTFSLFLTKSDNGITVNVSRLTSPYGGGSIGLLSNGATLYYGDTLSVSWAVQSGYMEDTLTVNSVDVSAETPPYPVTVNSSVTVVMTVKLGAIVYIENDLYQAFVYDGANWVQYEAYIYNGSSWDAY